MGGGWNKPLDTVVPISVAIGQCRVHTQEPITPTPNLGMGVGILLSRMDIIVVEAQFGGCTDDGQV